jgi:hypothetical protein
VRALANIFDFFRTDFVTINDLCLEPFSNYPLEDWADFDYRVFRELYHFVRQQGHDVLVWPIRCEVHQVNLACLGASGVLYDQCRVVASLIETAMWPMGKTPTRTR